MLACCLTAAVCCFSFDDASATCTTVDPYALTATCVNTVQDGISAFRANSVETEDKVVCDREVKQQQRPSLR